MAFLTAEQKKEQGLIHASPLRQRMMLWSAFQQPHINPNRGMAGREIPSNQT
jgi:hypothetical protein